MNSFCSDWRFCCCGSIAKWEVSVSEHEQEMRGAWWELAIAWKLYDTAVRERRYEDANYYARQREVAERRARELLRMAPKLP